jgi:beta-lactamase class A
VHPFGGGLTRLIEQRKGSVSAAVYVGATDRTYKFGEPLHVYTASIIKVAVLASLLQEGSLSPKERRLAQRMIELSDNDATTALWRKQGGAPALFTFFAAAGMRDTHSAPVVFLPWDGVQTTALDQVTMLRHVFDGSLLSPAAIRYELRLMQSVAPNDAWGVSAGATRGQTVALKNGWLPVDKEGWTINSVGVITNRDGSAYAMAVLSSGSPSMEYGIQTVELVASHVNAALAHAAQQRIR